MSENGYINVSDYLPTDGKTDIAEELQQLIDSHPNRTLFFPDGTYLLGKSVLTPAHPQKSVDLQLSHYAVLKASDSWASEEAMIRLGAKEPANDIFTPGSNYGLSGGILDCTGKAKGISIDGGRETYVRNCNIKNAVVGLHIKYGANCGSSDADILGVNITGTGALDSVGVLIEGFDNSLTNMRIGNVFVGVVVRGGGNMLRNIHPLYYTGTSTYDRYEDSVGFKIEKNGVSWFDYCYSDQFAVGFHTEKDGILQNCFCFWYSDKEKKHVALKSDYPFDGIVHNLTVGGAHHPEYENKLMENIELGENGVLENIKINGKLLHL